MRKKTSRASVMVYDDVNFYLILARDYVSLRSSISSRHRTFCFYCFLPDCCDKLAGEDGQIADFSLGESR